MRHAPLNAPMPDTTDPSADPSAGDSTDPAAAGHRVRIEPGGQAFVARPDQPLLAAARSAGLALPSSCRNGSCRACRCRLRSGRIVYLIEWPGLLAEEKAEGWILPCVACAVSDLVIEQPAIAGAGAGAGAR